MNIGIPYMIGIIAQSGVGWQVVQIMKYLMQILLVKLKCIWLLILQVYYKVIKLQMYHNI